MISKDIVNLFVGVRCIAELEREKTERDGYCQLKENCRDYSRENKGKVVKPPCFQKSFSPKSSAMWEINGESSTTEISKLTIPS
jgi:hypothetical protein